MKCKKRGGSFGCTLVGGGGGWGVGGVHFVYSMDYPFTKTITAFINPAEESFGKQR